MIDWNDKVNRSTLLCSVSGKAIDPGTIYYSTLLYTPEGFARRDYHVDAWQDSFAEKAISYWRHKRPVAEDDGKPRMVDNAVLMGIFHDMKENRRAPTTMLLLPHRPSFNA